MTRIFIFIIFIFNYNITNAQYFWGATYSPLPSTDKDSITIIDTISLPELNDQKIDSVYFLSNDTIYIHLCFSIAGGPQLGKTVIDYFKIGVLNAGHYVVKIEGNQTTDTLCFSGRKFLNSLLFPLIVYSSPNNILEEYVSYNSIYTTIVYDNLQLSTLPKGLTISIHDIQGRSYLDHWSADNAPSINTSSWNNGIYIISVESHGERKRWKVLKE